MRLRWETRRRRTNDDKEEEEELTPEKDEDDETIDIYNCTVNYKKRTFTK